MITTVIKRQLIIPPTKVKTQAQNLDHPSSLFNLSKKSNSSTPTYQRTPSSDGNAPAVTTSMAYLEKTAPSARGSESSQKISMSTRLREELWNKKEFKRLVTSSKLKTARPLELPEEIESSSSQITIMLSTTEAPRERTMVDKRRERLETGTAKAASITTSPSDKTATIAGCPRTKACRFCTVRTNNRWICTPSLVKCKVRCISNNLVCFILNRPSSNSCHNNLLHSNNLVNINNIDQFVKCSQVVSRLYVYYHYILRLS